eukprot:760398-Hanusia_phi.AAC.2
MIHKRWKRRRRIIITSVSITARRFGAKNARALRSAPTTGSGTSVLIVEGRVFASTCAGGVNAGSAGDLRSVGTRGGGVYARNARDHRFVLIADGGISAGCVQEARMTPTWGRRSMIWQAKTVRRRKLRSSCYRSNGMWNGSLLSLLLLPLAYFHAPTPRDKFGFHVKA